MKKQSQQNKTALSRANQRRVNALRPVTFVRHFTRHAGGSVLTSFGHTRVLCTAMIERGVPDWLKGKGTGWLTAEYAMLPSSTQGRKRREGAKPDGRSVEIQRLIGRTLRSVVSLDRLGENTLFIDCDVLQADGGTRTAAITGAYVAICDAASAAVEQGTIERDPLIGQVAAVSVGIVRGVPMLDLDYSEDSVADVDMNVAMLSNGRFVEIQATGEHSTFARPELDTMLALASTGIRQLHKLQRNA